MQYLTGADTVSLRSIGFDQVHGHRLIPPGMIDQKLRIDAEHPVQQIFVIVISRSSDRASGHIAHGKHSGGFQLLAVSGADSPEIRQRPVIPQKFPIADLIQFGDPDSVIIRFHMLRYNIHGNLAQVQIGSDSCCGNQSFFLENLCCNSGRQFSRCHTIGFQILCHIQEHLINRIDMNIFRCDIFQINIIDLGTIFQISRHPGRGGHKTNFQFRMPLQFIRKGAFSQKSAARGPHFPHGIYFSYFGDHFEQSCPTRDSIGFQRGRYRQADGLLRSGSIRHHQIRIQRIQPSVNALHGGIKRLQIHGNISMGL